MQSFLQYRRFRKHVARQYERDRYKTEALANADNSDLTSPSESDASNTPKVTDPTDLIDTRDPEKGEQSNGRPLDAHLNLEAHGITEEKEQAGDCQSCLPIHPTPTSRRPSRGGEAPEDMSRATTVPTGKSVGTALGTTLTGIDVRDRSTKEGGNGKVFVVGYEGENDMMNPHNWSFLTRLAATQVHRHGSCQCLG